MKLELLPDGRMVEAGYGSLKQRQRVSDILCGECAFSKLTCGNTINREVRVKMTPEDSSEDEILEMRLRRKRSAERIYTSTGYKLVDGVQEQIYKTEEDVPNALRCGWFLAPKKH